MLRFFRNRAPFFALLLLLALLVTLPGAAHPLPRIGLALFALLSWRMLSQWKARAQEQLSVDDAVSRAAADWDTRHGGAEELDESTDHEAWRESLRPDDGWRDAADDDLDELNV